MTHDKPILKLVKDDGTLPPKSGEEIVRDLRVTVNQLITIIYELRGWLMHSMQPCECTIANTQEQHNTFKAIEQMGGDLTAMARMIALNAAMRLANVAEGPVES